MHHLYMKKKKSIFIKKKCKWKKCLTWSWSIIDQEQIFAMKYWIFDWREVTWLAPHGRHLIAFQVKQQKYNLYVSYDDKVGIPLKRPLMNRFGWLQMLLGINDTCGTSWLKCIVQKNAIHEKVYLRILWTTSPWMHGLPT